MSGDCMCSATTTQEWTPCPVRVAASSRCTASGEGTVLPTAGVTWPALHVPCQTAPCHTTSLPSVTQRGPARSAPCHLGHPSVPLVPRHLVSPTPTTSFLTTVVLQVTKINCFIHCCRVKAMLNHSTLNLWFIKMAPSKWLTAPVVSGPSFTEVCDSREVAVTDGYILSPGFPNIVSAGFNQSCSCVVRARATVRIRVKALYLRLAALSSCSEHLAIYGDRALQSQLLFVCSPDVTTGWSTTFNTSEIVIHYKKSSIGLDHPGGKMWLAFQGIFIFS